MNDNDLNLQLIKADLKYKECERKLSQMSKQNIDLLKRTKSYRFLVGSFVVLVLCCTYLSGVIYLSN